MAVATIAELCRKLGEKVFMEIIRLLQASSKSTDDVTRESTCLALVHILYAFFLTLTFRSSPHAIH